MSLKIQHCAVIGDHDFFVNKILAGDAPEGWPKFDKKYIAYFSDESLERFVEEEYRHGRSALRNENERSIRTFSAGEKRKALLKYLLSQNPELLILDDLFDSLDTESVEDIKNRLQQLSEEIPMLQLLKRCEDLLPFVEKIIVVENNSFRQISASDLQLNLFQKKENFNTDFDIPQPLKYFKNIPHELVKMDTISVAYEGRSVLKNINWTIKKGEFWQLFGPNGSGKTTLLSMIFGDNPKAYRQELYLFGRKKGSGESVWEIKEKIGYFSPAVTEMFRGNYNLEQMLISGLFDSIGLYQKPTNTQKNLAKKWLRVLGLEVFGKQVFYKASRLNQRKILIGRSMIKHPPLLILDEPTTGLDDASAFLIVQLINKIAAESDTAVIYVSHRKENNLSPQYIYRLIPSENGSKGEKISS